MKLAEIIINLSDVDIKDEKSILQLNEKYINDDNDLINLVKYMDKMIPKFALKSKEYEEKYKDNEEYKGELIDIMNNDTFSRYCELLLFCFLDEHFKLPKFVTKILLKGGSKEDEAKGFDCAHITKGDDGNPCLWMGEAKFQGKISGAIDESLNDVEARLINSSEFLFLSKNICEEDVYQDNIYTEEEIKQFNKYVNGSNSNTIIINIILPIFIITDSNKSTFKDEKERIIKLLSKPERIRKIERIQKLNTKFKDIKIKFYILPIETVNRLREIIRDNSMYAIKTK